MCHYCIVDCPPHPATAINNDFKVSASLVSLNKFNWSVLLVGSFAFLAMGPSSILFLVFSLSFLGALVNLWLAGFHHFIAC
jgi:hypothetical protein